MNFEFSVDSCVKVCARAIQNLNDDDIGFRFGNAVFLSFYIQLTTFGKIVEKLSTNIYYVDLKDLVRFLKMH